MNDLFLILDDGPEFLSRFTSSTCDDSRIADSHIEAAPQDPINRGDRMRDMISFTLPRSTGKINEKSLVILPRRNAQRRARHLGRDLIDSGKFYRTGGT